MLEKLEEDKKRGLNVNKKCHKLFWKKLFADPYKVVSLGAGCKNLGKAAHETMHALGFIHEHQSWGISQ